ncbi:MAG: three-Cys-motif partner protein TcmP [Chloroflexota bacterium]
MSIQSSQAFFGELREWSERKLNILEKYLDPFVKILGSKQAVNHVYYVDAFAGAGLYRDGEKGSALRAAELAQSYDQANKPYRLKCISIEADQDNFKNLQANTVSYGSLVQNYFGTFAENIDKVLQQTSGNPALFFLDPFGIKGMDWNLIQRIIHRGNATDLWIRFDHTAVTRLNERFKGRDKGARKSFDILCQSYGVNDRTLLHKQLSGNSAKDRKQNAVQFYMSRLENEIQKARGKHFVAAYPIRSIIEQDKYFLVFATGHAKGASIASELICSSEDNYQQELEDFKTSGIYQPSLFNFEPSKEEVFQNKVAMLAESIWTQCKNEKLTREEVYERILPEWFGKIRSKHLTHALKVLLDDGRIKRATGTPGNRKTRFTF